jgi:hypothetical protein
VAEAADPKPQPEPPRIFTKQETLQASFAGYSDRAKRYTAAFTEKLEQMGITEAIEWAGEEALLGELMLAPFVGVELELIAAADAQGMEAFHVATEERLAKFTAVLAGGDTGVGKGPWHPNSTSIMANVVAVVRANALRQAVAQCKNFLRILAE